jgi:polysaccharide deacetylase family protein (PEP-CTERM system associated)
MRSTDTARRVDAENLGERGRQARRRRFRQDAPVVRPLDMAAPDTAIQRLNALTVDVEDYFQVEAFAGVIDRGNWEVFPRRVARNTDRILDIFADVGVSATFFTLGWVAERHPELVRRIIADGHELASHGSDHFRADQQSPEEFREDVRRSKELLEDIGGTAVAGYRAPTFSVGAKSRWAHRILAEEGFRYSSSVYPIAHDLYGAPAAPRRPFCPRPGFIEIPLTTVRMFGRNFPSAGGGYFRLLPYRVSRIALRKAGNELRTPCVFYLHPWEIDPGQPRQMQAPLQSQLRHYLNLSRTEDRLRRLLQDFRWTRMDRLFLDGTNPQPPLIESWLTRPPH